MYTDKRCPGTILNVDIAPIHGGLWISLYDVEAHENVWEGSLADLTGVIEVWQERDKYLHGEAQEKVGAR
jgi:hypothetical protein